MIFDKTMTDIADNNIDIFSTQTSSNTRIPLFEKLTNYVTDEGKRAPFARALIDKLVNFTFEDAFGESYDFFASIFEYMIKDYNTNGGGVYAEYYTPHAIAVIMARLLVGDAEDLHNIECYDPAAGTGTLLMALGHQVGEDRCTIFAQDRSQKSNKMLKLNLILNGLVSSLDHAVQGDTLTDPFHKSDDGQRLRQFDYVVCNPPFKLDFSETREQIAAMSTRFWAGVPKVPAKKKESMAIYTCFIQHVLNSLKANGKGAIVLPTGFLTAKSGVEVKILKHIVEDKIVYGVISMPSNVFANTGTNVSVVFFDNSRTAEKVVLIDASKLGEEYQEGSNKKVHLTPAEIDLIVDTFTHQKTLDDEAIDDAEAQVDHHGEHRRQPGRNRLGGQRGDRAAEAHHGADGKIEVAHRDDEGQRAGAHHDVEALVEYRLQVLTRQHLAAGIDLEKRNDAHQAQEGKQQLELYDRVRFAVHLFSLLTPCS